MTTLYELMSMVATHGGKIISTAELTSEEIELARNQNRMFVDDDWLGFVWIRKDDPAPQDE